MKPREKARSPHAGGTASLIPSFSSSDSRFDDGARRINRGSPSTAFLRLPVSSNCSAQRTVLPVDDMNVCRYTKTTIASVGGSKVISQFNGRVRNVYFLVP